MEKGSCAQRVYSGFHIRVFANVAPLKSQHKAHLLPELIKVQLCKARQSKKQGEKNQEEFKKKGRWQEQTHFRWLWSFSCDFTDFTHQQMGTIISQRKQFENGDGASTRVTLLAWESRDLNPSSQTPCLLTDTEEICSSKARRVGKREERERELRQAHHGRRGLPPAATVKGVVLSSPAGHEGPMGVTMQPVQGSGLYSWSLSTPIRPTDSNQWTTSYILCVWRVFFQGITKK